MWTAKAEAFKNDNFIYITHACANDDCVVFSKTPAFSNISMWTKKRCKTEVGTNAKLFMRFQFKNVSLKRIGACWRWAFWIVLCGRMLKGIHENALVWMALKMYARNSKLRRISWCNISFCFLVTKKQNRALLFVPFFCYSSQQNYLEAVIKLNLS